MLSKRNYKEGKLIHYSETKNRLYFTKISVAHVSRPNVSHLRVTVRREILCADFFELAGPITPLSPQELFTLWIECRH